MLLDRMARMQEGKINYNLPGSDVFWQTFGTSLRGKHHVQLVLPTIRFEHLHIRTDVIARHCPKADRQSHC